jgi:hypothetical protein
VSDFLNQLELLFATSWKPLILCLAAVIGGTFYFTKTIYEREISTLKTERDGLRVEVADYKEKLKGATPAEAQDRIKLLEMAVGKKWRGLTAPEAAKLVASLKPLADTFRVQIMYSNALGKEFAENVRDAFVAAGWTKYTFSIGGGLESGLSVGVGSQDALKLQAALAASMPIKVDVSRPNEAQWGDLIYLSIGINDQI